MLLANLAIRCVCGAVQATASQVSPGAVNRVVCHCQGCQAYAHVLGRANAVLDRWGGTDVFQMSPRRLHFTAGFDQVACMRLTDKGALRWYARCCNTPLVHTLPSGNVPFMAVNHFCVDWSAAGTREDLIGPVRARVNGTFRGDGRPQPNRSSLGALLGMLWHYAPLLARWRWQGDHKHSPFFDAHTGAPMVAPVRVRVPALEPPPRSNKPNALQRAVRGCG